MALNGLLKGLINKGIMNGLLGNLSEVSTD